MELSLFPHPGQARTDTPILTEITKNFNEKTLKNVNIVLH